MTLTHRLPTSEAQFAIVRRPAFIAVDAPADLILEGTAVNRDIVAAKGEADSCSVVGAATRSRRHVGLAIDIKGVAVPAITERLAIIV